MSSATFARFLAVGAVSFIIDGGGLLIATRVLGIDPFTARIFSFSAALVAGWLFNRSWAFKTTRPPSLGEFGRYFLVQGVGAAVNFVIYSALLLFSPVRMDPIIALVIAAVFAALVNFSGAARFVFPNTSGNGGNDPNASGS